MWNPFIDRRKHPQDAMFRWRVPLIARGAVGDHAGHWRVLGVEYRWNWDSGSGWSDDSSIRLWGIVAVVNRNTKGGKLRSVGPEWSVRWAKIIVKWVPADMY